MVALNTETEKMVVALNARTEKMVALNAQTKKMVMALNAEIEKSWRLWMPKLRKNDGSEH